MKFVLMFISTPCVIMCLTPLLLLHQTWVTTAAPATVVTMVVVPSATTPTVSPITRITTPTTTTITATARRLVSGCCSQAWGPRRASDRTAARSANVPHCHHHRHKCQLISSSLGCSETAVIRTHFGNKLLCNECSAHLLRAGVRRTTV